jgi:hypothetical protein
MKTIEYRVLIIDDDDDMLRELSKRVSGVSVELRKRRIEIHADTLRVEVTGTRDSSTFSDTTFARFLELARTRYDYVIADYSFANPEMQAAQWNEGARTPAKLDSNHHLLTLVDLRDYVVAQSRKRSEVDAKLAEAFFRRRIRLLLRSFQHDRTFDKLGPYEARIEAARGVFTGVTQLDRLDGFSQIYGSDPALREELYHGSTNGRRLYRNVVIALSLQAAQTAVLRSLASRATMPPQIRSANRIALLVGAVAALATVVQLVAGPMIDAATQQSWLAFTALALVTIVTAYVGSFLIALLVESGVRQIVGRNSDD